MAQHQLRASPQTVRIGVFDGQPLWACRYYMAGGHWQIVQNLEGGKRRSGRVQAFRLEDVPSREEEA